MKCNATPILTWNLILIELNQVISPGAEVLIRVFDDAEHVSGCILAVLVSHKSLFQQRNRLSTEAWQAGVQH